jgi:multisubunit Na+/H+ antiporter MnhB subunit
LLLALLELPQEAVGLRPEVMGRLAETGVEHPVTAVLLNFRGYDTWLETGVLLAAVMAVLALLRLRDLAGVAAEPPAGPVLLWFVRVLMPLMVLAGGYLLWLGKHAPGGAFQAGVLLGAAGVLLKLAGFRTVSSLRRWLLHALLLLGFAAFLLLALGLLLAQRPMLAYPQAWAGTVIILLEGAVTVSVAVTVMVLVVGAEWVEGARQRSGASR